MSAVGMTCLAAALPLVLEQLDIRKNPVGDEGIVALAARLPPQLRVLRLGGKAFPSLLLSPPPKTPATEFADQGCLALSLALRNHTCLEVLDIRRSVSRRRFGGWRSSPISVSISEDAVKTLVDRLPQSILELDMSGLALSL